VYGEFIGKRNNSQEAPLQLIDFGPKPISVVLLGLDSNRRLKDANAHLLRQIWSLLHHLIFKVGRKTVSRHPRSLSKTVDTGRRSGFFFEKGDDLLTRDAWETFEEILDRIAAFEVIDEVLDRHTGTGEAWRSAHDFRIDFYHRTHG